MLATTVVGVYLLLIVGASTTLTDAGETCTTWPACDGQWLVPLSSTDPQLLIAWGHRVATLVVGGVAIATIVTVWRANTRRRVTVATLLALTLYPLQIAIGAVIATSSAPTVVTGTHLGIGVGLFGLLVGALAWHLEAETPGETDDETLDPDELERPEPVDDEEESPRELPEAPLARAKLTALAYVRMTKPRLMWLLCLVAAAGMALAAGSALTAETVLLCLGGGVLSIGASGTFNHVLERDIDRRMERTSDRPLATDLVPVGNAITFGVLLTVASLVVFAQLNYLAAALGLVAILFYSVIYTLVLKPNTVQNTVIGGFAGALPALIGWAAVTDTIGLPGLALAGVIFLWTPAHFYNLALAYRDDYERGGFPMLPVVHGESVTRKHILWYLGATLASASVLSAVGNLGLLYALTSVALGGVFLWAVIRLHRERTESAAFRAFHASNAYLGCLLLAIVLDTLVV
jgi:protoheme IX farnesyltransferase